MKACLKVLTKTYLCDIRVKVITHTVIAICYRSRIKFNKQRGAVLMKKRNHVVDMIKLIASYFVIFLHFPFQGTFGTIVFALSRFAVPFFFIVSGYFYSKSDKNVQYKSTKTKIRHILLLLCVAEFLNFMGGIIGHYDFRLSIFRNVIYTFIRAAYAYDVWRVISFTPLFNFGAWFLVQLIAVYLIYALFSKLSVLRYSKYLAIGGFLSGFLFIRICYLLKIELVPYLDYFILFMGFPFFSLGYHMKEISFSGVKMKNPYLAVALLVGMVLSYCEKLLFPTANVYLGSILINLVCVTLFIKYEGHLPKTYFGKLLSWLGNKISLYIYILHPLVGTFLSWIFSLSNCNSYISYLKPIVICVITTMISAIVFYVNRLLRKTFTTNKRKRRQLP